MKTKCQSGGGCCSTDKLPFLSGILLIPCEEILRENSTDYRTVPSASRHQVPEVFLSKPRLPPQRKFQHGIGTACFTVCYLPPSVPWLLRVSFYRRKKYSKQHPLYSVVVVVVGHPAAPEQEWNLEEELI